MKRILEPIKTILIIALTASMLVMAARLMLSDIFSTGTGSVVKNESSFFTGLGLPRIAKYFEKGTVGTQSEFSQSALVYPYCVSIRQNGVQISAFADEERIISSYDAISDTMERFIAGEVTQSENSFETYVKNDGVLIDFGRKIPLDILCRITANKASNTGDILIERLYIYDADGKLNSVFTDGEKTYAFEAVKGSVGVSFSEIDGIETSDASALDGILTDVKVNGGSAVPIGQISLPLVEKNNKLYNTEAGNYSFANLSAVLTKFGINSGSLNNEIKEDGSVIYVENLRSIMAQTDGRITFAAYQDNGGISLVNYIGQAGEKGYSVRDVIIASQKFLSSFDKELLGGAASMRLKNAYYDSQQKGYVTEFEYCVNGISVKNEETSARLVYRNGYFVDADILLENYAYSQQKAEIEDLENFIRLYANRSGTLDRIMIAYIGNKPDYLFYWED